METKSQVTTSREANKYLPPALPLLSDGRLCRTLRDYEEIHDRLAQSASEASRSERAQLESALQAIQRELKARGIGSEPWWAARQQVERGSRPFRGGSLVGGGQARRVHG